MNLNQELRMARSLMSLMSLRWMLHPRELTATTIFNLCLSIYFPIHFISHMVHLIWWIDSLWTFKDVYSRNIKDHEHSEISLKSFNRCWVARGMVIITQFICAHHMREISTKHYCNSLFTKAKKRLYFIPNANCRNLFPFMLLFMTEHLLSVYYLSFFLLIFWIF